MSAAVKCEFCADTGMLGRSGHLDCTKCNAAVERAALEKTIGAVGNTLWRCYTIGKAAGAAQAVPAGWQLVPVEPTEEMIQAATNAIRSPNISHVIRAAIKAAKAP